MEQEDARISRILLLLEQNRFEAAEAESRRMIADDGDNSFGHSLLAESLYGQERMGEALDAVERAIHLEPLDGYPHSLRAKILLIVDRVNDARAAADQAIALNPLDPAGYELLGWISMHKTDWEGALQCADRALELDALHVGSLNLRAAALRALGRDDEADEVMRDALAEDPESSFSFANLGWRALHDRQYADAMRNFREALRLRPDNDWAKEGMVLALKARYPLYGLVLRYFLWMGRQRRHVRWMVLIGAIFGLRIIRGIAQAAPVLQPLAGLATALYWGFVFLSWTAEPLFNLLLRLNPMGRLVLSEDQIVASNWTGACLGSSALCLAVWLITRSPGTGWLALVFLVLTMPMAGSFAAQQRHRNGLLVATALIALAGLYGIVTSGQATGLSPLFLLGVVAHMWIANLLAVRD